MGLGLQETFRSNKVNLQRMLSCIHGPEFQMIESSLTYLTIKLISVPIFIWAVSFVARRWGPYYGGFLLGLPVASGPVVFFLALEQGNSFASGAAQGTLMGLISLSTSSLVYSRLVFRFGWLTSLIGFCMTYLTIALFLDFISAPLVFSFLVVVLFVLTIWRLMPEAEKQFSHVSPNWDIPARMIAATLLVLLITGSAMVLGPHLSGLLTFPIYATILAAFTHKFCGASACALFLKGLVTGCFSAGVFFFMIAYLIVQIGLVLATFLASLAAIAMHSLLLYLSIRNN